jgi:hypothetical protein
LRDQTGSDIVGLMFLAGTAAIGMLIVIALAYNPAIRRNLATRAAV